MDPLLRDTRLYYFSPKEKISTDILIGIGSRDANASKKNAILISLSTDSEGQSGDTANSNDGSKKMAYSSAMH